VVLWDFWNTQNQWLLQNSKNRPTLDVASNHKINYNIWSMELNVLEVIVLHYQHWISHNHKKNKCHFLHPYLSMKQGSLFCSYEIHRTGMLQIMFLVSLESSQRGGVQGSLFCFVLFCSYEIHQTGMLQIMFLVSLESSRWGGVCGLGSVMFGLEVQKFLDIEWFLHWKLN